MKHVKCCALNVQSWFFYHLLTVTGVCDIDIWWEQGLEFKGQMLYCHESDCLLFLASPLVDGLEALTSRGLFISDIPIHDATRDVILVGEQARAQVSQSYSLLSIHY